jgi:threonine dehydratase
MHALDTLCGDGGRLFLKCENFQRTRSFKVRGAFYAVSRLSPEQRARGVVTRSSGNFAQALALAGSVEGVSVTVVMPTTAPTVKVEGTRKFGATVMQHGTTHAEGLALVQELVASTGKVFLPPFDHLDVMVGQGTAGLEVCEELPSMVAFWAPVGGGGLMGGCATAVKGKHPNAVVVGVEPAGAADFAASFAAGHRVTLTQPASIADGLLAPAVGEVNWPVLRAHVDRAETVTEAQIGAALGVLYKELGLVVEPSAAVALAGFMNTAQRPPGDTVCLVSGGNVDLARFQGLVGA